MPRAEPVTIAVRPSAGLAYPLVWKEEMVGAARGTCKKREAFVRVGR
jgi:hypothetical protein